MRKFYSVIAAAFLVCIPLLSIGSPLSSNIPLEGGDIAANKDIEIFFNNLLESVYYQVRCTLTSDQKSNQDVDYIALYSAGFNLQASVNGIPLSIWQAKISTKQYNILEIKNVTKSSTSIIIRNLDDTDTISVTHCYAFPQV